MLATLMAEVAVTVDDTAGRQIDGQGRQTDRSRQTAKNPMVNIKGYASLSLPLFYIVSASLYTFLSLEQFNLYTMFVGIIKHSKVVIC